MSRIVYPCILALFVAGAFGCRMCGSPYDYCVPSYTDRCDDYRGCDPLYRAGSILYGGDGEFVDASVNAGNFGRIVPVDTRRPRSQGGTRGPTRIGMPETTHGQDQIDYTPPSMQELLKGGGTSPLEPFAPGSENLFEVPNVPQSEPIPVTPPATMPPAIPPGIPTPAEPMPFVSGNAVSDITVEELRRLDPSITDVKILNIDDTINSAFPKDSSK